MKIISIRSTLLVVLLFLLSNFSSVCFSICTNVERLISKTTEKSYYYEISHQLQPSKTQKADEIPDQALKVLKFIRENNKPMNGYVGGRKFGNYEGFLPKKDKLNQKIYYKEWDIYPKIEGKNRGAERLVTGSDQKAYYTRNHYKTFVEIK